MLKRILVLDDNQDILDIVNETLRYEQFEVQATTKGNEVIPMMEELTPDLVILDYRVADINGGEICQKIKTHPKFNNIPVIIFSAYINRDNELFAYGCDAVINKPFDLTELVEKVQRLLSTKIS